MLYRQIILEWGQDTESGVWGLGYSPDNGKNFYVLNTTHGRKYRAEDGNRLYPYISDQIQDKIDTVVAPAKSAADSAQSAADAAVASAQVTSDAVSAIASATAEAEQGANDAMSKALSAWDVATGAKEAVTDFDPLIKSAQSDASKALAQIADTANALSDAKTSFGSGVAEAKNLANAAQTTADSAVKSASSVANDLTAVASQAKANADGITKVTSDVGLLQTTVADNSGNISTIQETAKQVQQAVSDNAGNITVAKQTADSAVSVASDAKSNATVAIQTASQASITASNASGQAASAVITAQGAITTANNANSNATVAVQTASGASLTATNATNDATVANQTASEAKVQASNAESDFAQISIRAGQIEASVANNSGAIANVQQTANGLTTTVANITSNGGGRNLLIGTSDDWVTKTASGSMNVTTANDTKTSVADYHDGDKFTYSATITNNSDTNVRLEMFCCDNNGTRLTGDSYHVLSDFVAPNTTAKKVSCTIAINWNTWFVEHILIADDGTSTSKTVQIKGEMFEAGTIAHDWSPAPEDAQNQFAQIKQSIDGVTTTINDPKTGLNATYQTATGNATTISNVKSDVYQLETTATGLTSRVGNLESKTNTQETATEQNKNAIKLKADQTDVDTLKGNVTSLQAEVTTQADEIKNKVTRSDVTGMLTGYATQEYTQGLVTLKADEWNLNLTKLKNDTQTSVTNLSATVDGIKGLVETKADQSEVTQLSDLVQAKVSSGDFTSTTTQLKNMINQRVQVGDVISQINQEAGGDTLIQVSNGKKSLILDASNTIFTGKAWIPVAAIANLTADQVQAGTLSGSKVHAGDNSGNGIDMGALSTDYVGFHAYANNGDNTYIDLNGIHNYGANYDTRIQQGKITTNYLAVNGGGMIDFRDSNGTGMVANGSTLTFDVNNTPAGYLSYNGMPVAELPDGSGGNEFAIRYRLSTSIIPDDSSGAQATFSKAAQKIAYMTGTNQGKQMLSGLEVHSNNHHWFGAVNSDATYNRIEINCNDGVNLTWHDNTHFWVSDGNAKLYKDSDDGQTATKLEVHGWAWVNGWVEAAGHSQHSTLSSKTRIEEADPDHMLDLVNNTDLTTFAFKSEVAEGVEVRHIGPIIDDVNDVAQYQMPAEFIAPTKTARDDDNMIGALFGAVQALTKRIKKMEDKLNG